MNNSSIGLEGLREESPFNPPAAFPVLPDKEETPGRGEGDAVRVREGTGVGVSVAAEAEAEAEAELVDALVTTGLEAALGVGLDFT